MDDSEDECIQDPRFDLPVVTGTETEAQLRQQYQYTQDIATGRFKPAVGPWSSVDFLIFVITTYTAPARYAHLEWIFFIAIVAASVCSLLYYRTPGTGGGAIVCQNAYMVGLLVANFMIIRDVRNIRRVYGVMDQSEARHETLDVQNWQVIPNHPWLRSWWIMDLIACARAFRWSWNPQRVSADLVSKLSPNRSSFYKRQLVRFVGGYLGLDIIKCIMMADPHFYGSFNCRAPPPLQFLPSILIHAYRMLLASAAIACAVQCYGSAWALFKVGIFGSRMLRITKAPRMKLPLLESSVANFKHGLKGFQCQTWYQAFRARFIPIRDFFAPSCSEESWPADRPDPRALTRMSTVFGVNMIVHICAMYIDLGPSNPADSYFGFALHPVGVLLQAGLSELMHQSGERLANRAFAGGYVNLTFNLLWLMVTCMPLANDFSVGGIWMLEPVPVSFTRGLGMSGKDSRWFPWMGSPTADI